MPPRRKSKYNTPRVNLAAAGIDDPRFGWRAEMCRMTGVDLTAIPGIQAATVHRIFAEIGRDVSRFPTDKHFASWLGLCPDNRISGGRVLSVRTRDVKNQVADALRLAAQALHHSRTALGDYYRRMRAKLGAPMAITAAAHKLARIIYNMLKTGEPYDESHLKRQTEGQRRRAEIRLRRQAQAMGLAVVPL